MDALERSTLRAALLHQTICGDTATPRESVVTNAEKLAAGDPDKQLGLTLGELTAQSVMDDVAATCGCSASLQERTGPGVIDVDLTLDALSLVAERLRMAVQRRERVLITTGHPTGVMSMYMTIARRLLEAGCTLLTPRSGERLGEAARGRGNRVRYLDGVGAFTDAVHLYHTHESWPMEALLDALAANESGGPELVIADHGFAGAAISRGIETLAFADVNDPALLVAQRRGMTNVVVPLDDNREPERYLEMTNYLAAAATRI